MRRLMRAIIVLTVFTLGCGAASDERGAGAWTGSIDTLSSGQVVVHNTEAPIWSAGEEWRVIEELRIGSIEGGGPDAFGNITALEVDGAGRLWVFDSQSQELRVFSPSGEHVRTIGRKGGGPGEFAQAVHVELGPDGNVWVMDPENNRISVFDTAGSYVRSERALGGFIIMPWPGGFDAAGSYYAPVPQMGGDGFRVELVKYNASFVPVDTLEPPTDPIDREGFEHRTESGGGLFAGVPFQGGLNWRLSAQGTFWALLSNEYRLFELSPDGDTLRTITREFTPLPVTDADVEAARQSLDWFTEQGGRIDLSKLPDTKPAASAFFVDDVGNIWVERVTADGREGRVHDIFDPRGRFLGTVTLPFALSDSPFPIVRDDVLYGVAEDELGVEYIVRARIEKGTRVAEEAIE